MKLPHYIILFLFAASVIMVAQPLPKLPRPLPVGADAAMQPPALVEEAGVAKWTSKDFTLFSSALDHVNALPGPQRTRAYIIAMNSNRSSAFTGYYIAVYPE